MVEASHHEVAIGQHEIDFKYDDAMQTADNAVTFRTTLKAIAQQHGLYATFMPKPFFRASTATACTPTRACGRHDGQTNLFYDRPDEYHLSPIARSFMAGLLAHARGMIAILAPLVNSLQAAGARLRGAGVYQLGAHQPLGADPHSAGQPRPARGDAHRAALPGPELQPVPGLRRMLAAGLDGIERELAPPDPVEENLYHFDEAKL